MIKQDYLIRMIQEIISLIVNALLKKKKYRWNEWTEYDGLTERGNTVFPANFSYRRFLCHGRGR